MYSTAHGKLTTSRLARNETRLERNETRLERNETRLARNKTRGGNLPLGGTVLKHSSSKTEILLSDATANTTENSFKMSLSRLHKTTPSPCLRKKQPKALRCARA